MSCFRELHLNHNLLRLLPYELGKLFNLQVLGLKVMEIGGWREGTYHVQLSALAGEDRRSISRVSQRPLLDHHRDTGEMGIANSKMSCLVYLGCMLYPAKETSKKSAKIKKKRDMITQ